VLNKEVKIECKKENHKIGKADKGEILKIILGKKNYF